VLAKSDLDITSNSFIEYNLEGSAMYMKKSLYVLYAVFVALLFISAYSPAFGEMAGTFTFIDGRVDILKFGQDRAVPVDVAAPVSPGDIVRTKSNARAEITLVNGTVIRLAEGTRGELTSYLRDDSGAVKEVTFTLKRGKMRVMNPGSNQDFNVVTPNARADNMKGADFYFIYEKGSTWFYGSKGSLRAARIDDPARAVSVKRHKCVKITVGAPMEDSCVFNNIDVKKYAWDTATIEKVPAVAQLPAEGEVYTYTPLGGKAVDTPSMPVAIAFDDLTCTQCPPDLDILLELTDGGPAHTPPGGPEINKVGNFERIDRSNGIPPLN
jgi:hypothetical protein